MPFKQNQRTEKFLVVTGVSYFFYQVSEVSYLMKESLLYKVTGLFFSVFAKNQLFNATIEAINKFSGLKFQR